MNKHATAIVDSNCIIGKDVEIGPYCIVEKNCEIGDGTKISSHCVIKANSVIGKNNFFYENIVIGGDPQDTSFDPTDDTFVKIGDYNILREFVTVHRSTNKAAPTYIKDKNYIMAYTHVGHDCLLGSNIIITNGVSLAGHVMIDDQVVIGGSALVHQHVRIGKLAMVAGGAPVSKDVIPFMLLGRNPAKHYSLNKVGLDRNKISKDSYRALAEAYKQLKKTGNLDEIKEKSNEIEYLISWLSVKSKRGNHSFL